MSKYEHLSPLEVLIYNRIKWLTDNGEYRCCSMSNGTLGDYFKRPKESISRTISKLKKLGYISEEREGTLRKLRSTNKTNIYNYVVKSDEEVVKSDEEVVKSDEEVVIVDDKIALLKSLLNDEVVIAAMTKSLSSDEEVVKHNIRKNIRYIIDELKDNPPKPPLKRGNHVLNFEGLVYGDMLEEFANQRKLSRKPMTQRAVELADKKLQKLAGNREEAQEIIDHCVLSGWSGIYLPNDFKKNDKKQETLTEEEEENIRKFYERHGL